MHVEWWSVGVVECWTVLFTVRDKKREAEQGERERGRLQLSKGREWEADQS